MDLSNTLKHFAKPSPLPNQPKMAVVEVPEEFQVDGRWNDAIREYTRTLEGREGEDFLLTLMSVRASRDARHLGRYLERVRTLRIPERDEIHEMVGYDL